MKVLLVGVGVLTLYIHACNSTGNRDISNGNDTVDGFYTDRGGFGTFLRVPLIRPYAAIKVSAEEWRLELQVTEDILAPSIHNVKEVNVVDSVILIHSLGETSIKHVNYNEAWFVILPSQNIEQGFPKKEDFLDYLKTQNVTVSKLYNVDLVYDRFYETQKIDWQKGP